MHSCCCLPITSISEHDGYVYFGEGSCLKRRSIDNDDLQVVACIPDNATIRVIKNSSSGLYVAAGYNLFVYDFESLHSVDFKVHDYILDLLITEKMVFVVTSHGNVVKLVEGQVAAKWLFPVHALFYSAHLLDDRLVCFGTIFSGLWIYELSEQGELVLVKKIAKHRGSIFGITSNSLYLCSCSDDRTIVVYCKKSLEVVRTFRGHDARVWCIHCDEIYIVSGSEDGTVRLWPFAGGAESIVARHWGKHVWSVQIRHQLVFSGGGDGVVRCSNISFRPPEFTMAGSRSFHLTSDDVLFAASTEGKVRKVPVISGQICYEPAISTYYESSYLKNFCMFASSKDILVGGGLDGRLHIISRSTGLVKIYSAIACKILAIQVFECDIVCQDARLAIHLISIDSLCNLTRIATLREERVLTNVTKYRADCFLLGYRSGAVVAVDGYLNELFSLNVCSDAITGLHIVNDAIYYCSRGGNFGAIRDGSIRSMEPKRNVAFEGLTVFDGQLCLIGFHEKSFVIIRCSDKEILFRIPCGGGHRLWQFMNGRLLYLREQRLHIIGPLDHQSKMLRSGLHGLETRCAIAHKEFLLSGGEDGALIMSDSKLNALYRVVFDGALKGVCRVSDRSYAVVGTKELTSLVEITEGNEIWVIARSDIASVAARNMCAAFSSPHQRLFVGSSDGRVSAWSIEEGRLLRCTDMEFFRCTNCVLSIECVHNGYLFVGTSNGDLHIVNISDKKLLYSIKGLHQGAITAVRYFEPFVYTCGDDGWIGVLSVGIPPAVVSKWHAHNGCIGGLCPLKSGRIVSVSLDQTLAVWDATDHSLIAIQSIPLTDVSCLTVNDNNTVLYCGGRGTISLDADCVAAPTCTLRTKCPRVSQSSRTCIAALPKTLP